MSANLTRPFEADLFEADLTDATRPPTHGWLAILRQVKSDFDEMPGLTLTVPNATRLWGVDTATAEQVLGALVDIGYLSAGQSGFMRRQEEHRRRAGARSHRRLRVGTA